MNPIALIIILSIIILFILWLTKRITLLTGVLLLGAEALIILLLHFAGTI